VVTGDPTVPVLLHVPREELDALAPQAVLLVARVPEKPQVVELRDPSGRERARLPSSALARHPVPQAGAVVALERRGDVGAVARDVPRQARKVSVPVVRVRHVRELEPEVAQLALLRGRQPPVPPVAMPSPDVAPRRELTPEQQQAVEAFARGLDGVIRGFGAALVEYMTHISKALAAAVAETQDDYTLAGDPE